MRAVFVLRAGDRLQSAFATIAITDANHIGDIGDEDFTVAYFAGACGRGDGIDHLFGPGGRNYGLKLDFWDEIDHVFAAPVHFFVTLLPTVAAYFKDCYALDPDSAQGIFHRVQPRGLQERALDFVVEARRTGFDGQVLVVTAGVTGQEAIQLVQSGVAGILHKQNTGDMLRDAVRKVSLGGVCLENDYLSPLFKTLDRTKQSSKPKLTDREKQMLRFIFQGFTNKEIGSEMDISEGAVKAALHVVFDKLGARTRAQLVKIALEQYKDEL